MERNVVIESFSVSEHIAGIVNGFSSDLLTHSPSKSFVNRCETRLRLLLLFLVCSLFNFVSLKAHQGLIAGTYTAEFDYDVVGTLAAARYNETDILYKLPDRIGNIYPDRFAKEARYERGGRLKEDKEWTYRFDGEGFLTERISKSESVERYDWIRRKRIIEPLTWSYTWDGAGQLVRVKNNDKVNLRFEYDALGRRTAKINAYGKAEQYTITRFLWDGNVPLHEWVYPLSERPATVDDSEGRRTYLTPEPQTELTTWLFDEGTFVPSAKIVGERRYSIISDYLGTPIEAYDEEGQRVWARELDVYGRVRIEQGEVGLVPFLYQGQYLDTETGLAYNRFRYYSPETGAYISQDLIRLEAGLTNLYAYVHDVNAWIDPWGLVEWSSYNYKHIARKNSSLTDLITSTKSGPAKYLPNIDVKALELDVWENGKLATNKKPWKVMEFDEIIGVSEGAPTRFVRVEMSANVIHGHPITEAE